MKSHSTNDIDAEVFGNLVDRVTEYGKSLVESGDQERAIKIRNELVSLIIQMEQGVFHGRADAVYNKLASLLE